MRCWSTLYSQSLPRDVKVYPFCKARGPADLISTTTTTTTSNSNSCASAISSILLLPLLLLPQILNKVEAEQRRINLISQVLHHSKIPGQVEAEQQKVNEANPKP